jgi:DNA-binding transcriptional MerR regulator
MKSPEAFRTISEAAAELGVPQHVLRFWETKFSFIRPMKRAGGRRFYRRQDIEVLRGVRALLHDEGYTIKGVQRLHKEAGVRRLLDAAGPSPATTDRDTASIQSPLLGDAARTRLGHVLADLEGVKHRLDRLLSDGLDS